MKKVLFSLFFICLFLMPAFADFQIDAVTVSANVAANGKTEVVSTYQLTFDSQTDSVTIPLPEGDMSKISAGDYRFKTKRTEDGTDVVISSQSGFAGTQTFSVSYVVAAEDDTDETQDLYHLNMLSTRWQKAVSGFSFQVVLPGSYSAQETAAVPEVQLISGYHGSLSQQDSALRVEGNIITGETKDLMSYDSMAVQITLPEGYFYVRTASIPVVSVTRVSLTMGLLLLLLMLYWRVKIYTPRQSAAVRPLPPEGLLPCQLPMVLDGATCDIPALILEWANLGYLSLSMSPRKMVMLTRCMEMGSERSRAEQKLYRNIFGNKMRVIATPGRYARAAAQFRASQRRDFGRIAFDRRGGNIVLVQLPCRLLLAVSCGYMMAKLLPEGGGFVILGVGFGVAGFLYSIYLHNALNQLAAHRKISVGTAVLILVAAFLILGGLMSGTLVEILVGLFACGFSAVATATGPRRSKRGQDLIAQTRGFRMYFRRVKWHKLQILQGRNPLYFQTQLPRVYAMGLEKTFAKRYERLPVPVPDWLPGKQKGNVTAQTVQKQVSAMMKGLKEAF